jgi:CDP-diacylglycerol--glycerol-3-phosphate 3-phosphatidyltransferase
LHSIGVSADALTIFGLFAALATGLLIANGNLLLALFGLILTGLPDILDGSVARHSGTAGNRGAFFDSVCDRVADGLIFVGVAWYLTAEDPDLAVLAMAVLALSMLISYERARAESLGYTARGGLMERLERTVLLGVGLAFDILVPVLWIMLVLTAITAVHRFVMVWRQATPPADGTNGKARGVKSRIARSHRARRPRRLPRVSGRR